jgi:hypothetical protein
MNQRVMADVDLPKSRDGFLPVNFWTLRWVVAVSDSIIE